MSRVRSPLPTAYRSERGKIVYTSELANDLTHDRDKMAAYQECVGQFFADLACERIALLERVATTTIFVAAFHRVYSDPFDG